MEPMMTNEYLNLIDSTYINTLRSVLLIDDDYPTLESFLRLNGTNDASGARTSEAAANVVKNIKSVRPDMLVYVDNGKSFNDENVKEYAMRLNQSDLVVLDYDLGDSPVRKSVNLVAHMLTGGHFNFIVIHTSIDNLNTPYREILKRVLGNWRTNHEIAEFIDQGEELFKDKLEDDTNVKDLSDLLGDQDNYFAARVLNSPKKLKRHIFGGKGRWAAVLAVIERIQLRKDEKFALVCYLLYRVEPEEINVAESAENVRGDIDAEYPWIRSGWGFVTFVSKPDESKNGASDLDMISVLREALVAWNPNPTRILAAKLRSEIYRHGVQAEELPLSNRHVQCQFLKEIRKSESDADKRNLLDDYIGRHFEGLMSTIGDAVFDFGCEIEAVVGSDNQIDQIYEMDSDDKKRCLYEYNSHISCLEMFSSRLTTGHVFRLSGDGNNDELWVCLSPACDLVRGTNVNGIHVSSEQLRNGESDLRPFIAARLSLKVMKENKVPDANQIRSNNYAFIKIDNSVKLYNIGQDGNREVTFPNWCFFTAKNKGRIEDKKIDLIAFFQEGDSVERDDELTGHVVAQFRSQYALNYLHKIGVRLTRVGLEYVA